MRIPKRLINPDECRAEELLQQRIVDFLRAREWFVKSTHGNLYQKGFPDLYCTHRSFGSRWIEVKVAHQYCFTAAQLSEFPLFGANGTGIWILVDATESEYKKLWQPPNWHNYLILLNQRSAH